MRTVDLLNLTTSMNADQRDRYHEAKQHKQHTHTKEHVTHETTGPGIMPPPRFPRIRIYPFQVSL